MALEEEFKLEIPDKEADKIDSCHLAVKYIHNHPMAGQVMWIFFGASSDLFLTIEQIFFQHSQTYFSRMQETIK